MMKTVKRAISVLLCIVSLFMLAIPAMAIDNDEAKMPVIKKQPQDVSVYVPVTVLDEINNKHYNTGIMVQSSGFQVNYKLYRGDELIRDEKFTSHGAYVTYEDGEGEFYLVIYNAENLEYYVESEKFTVKHIEQDLAVKIQAAINTFFFSIGAGIASAFTAVTMPIVIAFTTLYESAKVFFDTLF